MDLYIQSFLDRNQKGKLILFQEIFDFKLKFNLKSNLLLGNGFNRKIGINFDFNEIYNQANLSEGFKAIFKKFKTYDFEKAMEICNDAKFIFEQLSKDLDLQIDTQLIDSKINSLKEEFISSITKINQDKDLYKKVTDKKFYDVIPFLKKFENIFTLNYDLILYWAINFIYQYDNPDTKEGIHKLIDDGYCDNFSNRVENKSFFDKFSKKNIIFLHGALHIFVDDEQGTYKLIRTDTNLIELVSMMIKIYNKYPLCVTGGTSDDKVKQINNNEYLKVSYSFLLHSNCEILVILGASLKENDKHIRDAIVNNPNLKYIFIASKDYPYPHKELEEEIQKFNENNIFDENKKFLFYFDRDKLINENF